MTTHGRSVEEFERYVIQTVVMTMLSAKVINSSEMNFLWNANSLRDNYFHALMNNVGIKSMFSTDKKQYLLVLAYHAFGAGAYITVNSDEDHEKENVREASAKKIFADLVKVGSLELGLKAIYIDPQSNNKKVIDHIMISSINDVYTEYQKELSMSISNQFHISLMQVYFNVGVTVAMRRIAAAHR
jgi:hypothetical protein